MMATISTSMRRRITRVRTTPTRLTAKTRLKTNKKTTLTMTMKVMMTTVYVINTIGFKSMNYMKITPLAPFSDVGKFGWEVELMKAYSTNAMSFLICQVIFIYSLLCI